jgi:hypothetical protein
MEPVNRTDVSPPLETPVALCRDLHTLSHTIHARAGGSVHFKLAASAILSPFASARESTLELEALFEQVASPRGKLPNN